MARKTHRFPFLPEERERLRRRLVLAVMSTRLKRLPLPLSCALVAAIGGLIAGTATVNGLRQNRYGPVDPPALVDRAYGHDAAYYGGGAATPAGCQGCSERDLGYRWAVLAAVRSPDQCPDDSWGFRRGCLDYVGGT